MTGDKWLDAQYSVLGSALISPETVPQILQETRETDFAGPCRTVYTAIRELFLAGTPIDPVALANKLGDGYRTFLLQLMEITPTAANIETYLRITREQAKASTLRELGKQMAAETDPKALQELLDRVNGAAINRPAVKITSMRDAMHSFFDRKRRETVYLTWPVAEFNQRIFSELGDLVIIGGRPSSGKSAWALQCAWHWAKKYRVGVFSLETSADRLFDRHMSALSDISLRDIKRSNISDEQWLRLGDLADGICERPMEIIDAAGMTVSDIRAVTMMQGYQIVVIDYLQLLQGPGTSRYEQVTEISIALHTMARTLGVTVVALSQLARSDDKKGSRAPDMDSLRESGQIEQDADVVMLLNTVKDSDDRELWVRKNKEGTCFQALLNFDGDHQTFAKALSPEAQAEIDKFKRARKKPKPTPVIGQPEQELEQLPMDEPVPF